MICNLFESHQTISLNGRKLKKKLRKEKHNGGILTLLLLLQSKNADVDPFQTVARNSARELRRPIVLNLILLYS